MTKHTEGPWVISEETTKGQFVTETHIRDENGYHIALVGPCEIEPNARLIAAAPDLLEALKMCLPLVEQFDGTSVENEKILDTARAAIAKARGES